MNWSQWARVSRGEYLFSQVAHEHQRQMSRRPWPAASQLDRHSAPRGPGPPTSRRVLIIVIIIIIMTMQMMQSELAPRGPQDEHLTSRRATGRAAGLVFADAPHESKSIKSVSALRCIRANCLLS